MIFDASGALTIKSVEYYVPADAEKLNTLAGLVREGVWTDVKAGPTRQFSRNEWPDLTQVDNWDLLDDGSRGYFLRGDRQAAGKKKDYTALPTFVQFREGDNLYVLDMRKPEAGILYRLVRDTSPNPAFSDGWTINAVDATSIPSMFKSGHLDVRGAPFREAPGLHVPDPNKTVFLPVQGVPGGQMWLDHGTWRIRSPQLSQTPDHQRLPRGTIGVPAGGTRSGVRNIAEISGHGGLDQNGRPTGRGFIGLETACKRCPWRSILQRRRRLIR